MKYNNVEGVIIMRFLKMEKKQNVRIGVELYLY